MSILVNKDTRLIVQGITGKTGTFHTKQCVDYGTRVVAGVTPNKGGLLWEDTIPVCNTVAQAVNEYGANASVIYVPPAFAGDSILESIEAEIPLVICITEGVPVKDMAEIKQRLNVSSCKTRLIGPNCPGIITPEECKIGIMPGYIHKPGRVGVVSRSGTLTYEAVWQLTQSGHGQSTCIGIGGDPINGTSQTDAIRMFNEDPDTDAIIMIGEIGGSAEEEACAYIKEHVQKPVAGFIAGASAPKGRTMGHAGAIVSSSGAGTAEAKFAAMQEAGISIARNPSEIAKALLRIYKA
ncbi:MAG: succinate--CoA ligase subunit alpha [Puniceicoccaceae bacterium MED-G31]|nr:MAG: succinate--CoA ligase subunit alpha [Puniceicoccaceae bacterium MED-G31]|tara:strand:- start:28335 stop:29219 length:885 start_codon:yes stop_codon:yes gene_type:complete